VTYKACGFVTLAAINMLVILSCRRIIYDTDSGSVVMLLDKKMRKHEVGGESEKVVIVIE